MVITYKVFVLETQLLALYPGFDAQGVYWKGYFLCFDPCIKHTIPKWPPHITKSTIHVAQEHKFGFSTNVFLHY